MTQNMRTEPLGEDRTLALLRHREKQENGTCPVCLGFLDWTDHFECIEALSPSKVERIKPRDRKKELEDFLEESLDKDPNIVLYSHP